MKRALSVIYATVGALVASPPARADTTTDWAYYEPVSIAAARLWSPGQFLTNPVFHDGAVYVVVACPEAFGYCLRRIADAGQTPARLVDERGRDLKVEKGSFAFVAPEGRLELVTKKAIHGCDLTTLREGATTLRCRSVSSEPLTVNGNETPAMGPDGSLYYRNADGYIVGFDSKLRKIGWTDKPPKSTAVSPIALSPSGRHAYLLADIPEDAKQKKTSTFALLRIDTASGKTERNEIGCAHVRPLLKTLFRPTVVSQVVRQRSVDHVFVAANTSDTGILQLVTFEETGPATVVWTQSESGRLASAPVLGKKDGAPLLVVQNDELKCYRWWDATRGSPRAQCGPDSLYPLACASSAIKLDVPSKPPVTGVTGLLVDGADSVYLYGQSLYVHPRALRTQQIATDLILLFTADGALLGYNRSQVYDLSPKARDELRPPRLTAGTIYRADNIDVSSAASRSVKRGDRVILKGSAIALRKGFRWPLGATLTVQSVHRTQ